MYKVIKFFTDLQDDDHAYNAGDTFPREGMTVTKARLEELAGAGNRRGCPLIEKVAEEKPEPAEAPKEAPKAKRRSKKKNAD